MDGREVKGNRKIMFFYYSDCQEIEIIEANPHDNVDKYFVSEKSIRLDITDSKGLYLLLKSVFNDSDT